MSIFYEVLLNPDIATKFVNPRSIHRIVSFIVSTIQDSYIWGHDLIPFHSPQIKQSDHVQYRKPFDGHIVLQGMRREKPEFMSYSLENKSKYYSKD